MRSPKLIQMPSQSLIILPYLVMVACCAGYSRVYSRSSTWNVGRPANFTTVSTIITVIISTRSVTLTNKIKIQSSLWKLKRRLSSGKRWKIICERYHSYYASVEEHQIRHVPWKAWLFKCLHILNMSCNIVKLQGRIFTPCVCVVPYTSFCVQCLQLYLDLAKFLIILMIPEPCNTHKFLYARWSTFSGPFHTVSFTMQSHDQNSTSSLISLLIRRYLIYVPSFSISLANILVVHIWGCLNHRKPSDPCWNPY